MALKTGLSAEAVTEDANRAGQYEHKNGARRLNELCYTFLNFQLHVYNLKTLS